MTLTSADKGAVLLLGGTGYIGRHLARKLAQQGYQVFVTYSSPSSLAAIGGFWEGVPRRGGISAVQYGGDASSSLLKALGGHELKACINLIGNSTEDGATLKKSNIDTAASVSGLFTAIKAEMPGCATYHFSSIAALKKSDRSLYAESKDEGEKIIRSANSCNYVVYHSIVDSNTEKIAEDLSKLAPIFRRSAQLIDRVELTTISIDFLTDAITHHIAMADTNAHNTELVVLEKEITLREFMNKVVGPVADEESAPIALKDISDAVSKAGLPDSVLKRFENFIRLASIDDVEKRNAENHYFYFGRIQEIKAFNQSSATFKNNKQSLFSVSKREFILPIP